MDRAGGPDASIQPVESSHLEYDPESQAYRARFGPPDSGTVGEVIVACVATIEGVDPTALPAVYDVVDPEAVDRLLGYAGRGPTPDDVVVEFPYAGYVVTVLPGEVLVRSPGEGPE